MTGTPGDAPSYIFGPVESRRYGKSLGVDPVRMKTCTFSCRFCQLGETPPQGHTAKRTSDPPIEDILAALRARLASCPPPDFITAGGSGEPTLHLAFGDIFRFVRSETDCSSLLLSNGSLFDLPEVRRDAALADVVKVSLGAWDEESFRSLVRPAPGVAPFEKILEGYREFRQTFPGRLDCEVFLVPGFNDTEEACARIAEKIEHFSPDTVSLNTAVRPGADPSVAAVPQERIEVLRAVFGERATPAGAERAPEKIEATPEAFASLVSRHPVSIAALAKAAGVGENEALSIAAAAGLATIETQSGRYAATRPFSR